MFVSAQGDTAVAKIIEERVKDTVGREAGLAVAGRVFLVAGIVALLASIVFMIVRGEFSWLAWGSACMVSCAVLFLIFNALAEIIVLLKRLCGLPVHAVISGTREGRIFLCSECGSMTWADSVKCCRCGAAFEAGEPAMTDQAATGVHAEM